jgi:hypothetical protein
MNEQLARQAPAPISGETTLEWVRRRLDQLVEVRRERDLTADEVVAYEELCRTESRLIGTAMPTG